MVALDYQSASAPQAPAGQHRSGSLMVRASAPLSGEILLKFGIELADVVPEARIVRGFTAAEAPAEFLGKLRDCPEVFCQVMPMAVSVG